MLLNNPPDFSPAAVEAKTDEFKKPVSRNPEFGEVASRFTEELGRRLGKAGYAGAEQTQTIARDAGLFIGFDSDGRPMAARPSPVGDGTFQVMRTGQNDWGDEDTKTVAPPVASPR